MKGYFTFDNLCEAELGDYLRRGVPTAVFGVSDAHKYLLASLCEERCVYMTADVVSARKAAESIRALSGKRVALLCAKDEVLMYREALSKDSVFRRINALYEWQKGADVLVCDAEAAIGLVPRKLPVFTLKVGEETDMAELIKNLVRCGYSREYEVESKGSFAVRGDILDIYPVNCEHPARIDFFGDEVEAIKPYDEITGDRLPTITEMDICSATDVVYAESDRAEIEEEFADALKRAKDSECYVRLKKLSEEILSQETITTDFVLPLLENSCDLFTVIGEDTRLIFDECKSISDTLDGLYKEHEERFKTLLERGEVLPCSFRQYVEREDFFSNVSGTRALALHTFASDTAFFKPLKLFNLNSSPVSRYLNSIPDLLSDLRAWRETGYRVLIWCGNAERVINLRKELDENYFSAREQAKTLSLQEGIVLLEEQLESGLILHAPKLVLIGTTDLFTKRPTERRVRKKRGDLFLSPEVGDYAVHESYGVGRIAGMTKIETLGGIKEYVALDYKDGDKVYVPVEQMDILSKYMGEDTPTLSKIGGGEFERVKARVRASLKAMAFDLKQLYAERQEKKGYVFPENREMMDEFAMGFPYEETPDQLTSIEEVLSDMCSAKVMDRLLCGDVGFGKTEVALRAAYLCVLDGRQAALMCPSTVLSEQHFRTAVERMESFGVRIACLNRFRTPAAQSKILAQLALGEIDLIIGTHRLLSSDVKFRDLGLLILDEEQRFGVEHKEKIKNLKRDVDCLTMSATPIPRTLHMSLSGIRDISTIQTPPHFRLPVQTYVAEETETLIRDACIREISRDGQVFILYNRVDTIYSFAAKVAQLIPEVRIVVAHGQMTHEALEKNVFGFYRHEYDILITTTIIENGIDLPNANTIIVIDSDRLGISQLYQLRGRVGRGKRLAHAYFTFKSQKVMTQAARERLKAIMQFTQLGSGYKIAMRDLEIRGAGNVLGAEQHGHMDKVGYELYSRILKEELTGVRHIPCELDIKLPAFIPESYIESNAGRMDTYKQIAEIRSIEDFRRIVTSLEETYGEIPQEVKVLLQIAMLKVYAAPFDVRKITANEKGGTMQFDSLDFLSDDRISAAMERYRSRVSLDMTSAPTLQVSGSAKNAEILGVMIKFLKFAITFA